MTTAPAVSTSTITYGDEVNNAVCTGKPAGFYLLTDQCSSYFYECTAAQLFFLKQCASGGYFWSTTASDVKRSKLQCEGQPYGAFLRVAGNCRQNILCVWKRKVRKFVLKIVPPFLKNLNCWQNDGAEIAKSLYGAFPSFDEILRSDVVLLQLLNQISGEHQRLLQRREEEESQLRKE